MSKLGDEIAGFKDMLKGGGSGIVREFNNPYSSTVLTHVRTICKSQPLTYFMLGMSVEALGLSLQFMFSIDAYPILDFIVAGFAALALYAYQNPRKKHV
jgi:hypothetical protein